jgi:hypothetical protein
MRVPSILVTMTCLTLCGCVMNSTGTGAATPVSAAAAGAGVPGAPPIDPNAWTHITSTAQRSVVCGELPIMLDVSHAKMSLTGTCGYVRLTGDHNDITIDLDAAGTIEVTGAHNDISWKQAVPGAPPTLLNHGQSNSFHARRA